MIKVLFFGILSILRITIK